MAPSILKIKTYEFAIEVVNLYKHLSSEKKEFVLSKQFLRAGTAIGALVAEAEFAQSKPDFISKLSIALKEAHETKYWLCLLKDTNYINEENTQLHFEHNDEIIKMLVASIKTLKAGLAKN